MKKLIICALALMCSAISFAETSEQQQMRKEREEVRKMAKSELTSKVNKETKKEAKRLAKEGWMVSPGALPLEKQLERSYLMQYEYDADMFPKYIMANAQSVGENYDGAKMAATSLAITNLAGQIQTEVAALIENNVSNAQLPREEATTVTESVMAAKNFIAQSIGRTITVTECYRILPNKNREVMLRIAYNADMAKQAAKQAIREDLKGKGIELQKELDKLLGF